MGFGASEALKPSPRSVFQGAAQVGQRQIALGRCTVWVKWYPQLRCPQVQSDISFMANQRAVGDLTLGRKSFIIPKRKKGMGFCPAVWPNLAELTQIMK